MAAKRVLEWLSGHKVRVSFSCSYTTDHESQGVTVTFDYSGYLPEDFKGKLPVELIEPAVSTWVISFQDALRKLKTEEAFMEAIADEERIVDARYAGSKIQTKSEAAETIKRLRAQFSKEELEALLKDKAS